MYELEEVSTADDIFREYRHTPIGLLLEYHNLKRPFDRYERARILIGMCMDNRKHLHIPDNFAYIIRSGGANLRFSEFKVSYAIGVGQVGHIALIAHNNCAMVNLASRKDQFIQGLVENAGWTEGQAEEHFMSYAPLFEIGNEIDFVVSEAKRLSVKYPKLVIAPMMYKVEDNRLYLIREH
jgi:carbonic anhydrase